MNRKDEYAKVLAEGTPYDEAIRQAADANGVPYEYLHKKIFNESSFNPNAKSPTGPLGLGQFTRATGRAYGLMTDEDRLDPIKSINASAAFTRDLMGTYKGDMLKVALAYNQGNGRLGAPQLAALDRGDFSKISQEGQQYMANLLDVAGDSPSKHWFSEAPNAPKLNSDFAQHTEGVSKQQSVVRGATPNAESFSLAEGIQPTTQRTFREMELDQNGPDKGAWDGTWDAVKSSLLTSVPSQIARNVTIEDHDPLDWINPDDTSNWNDQDFENIRKEGVDPQFFGFIFDYTRGHRDRLPEAIALAKENMAHEQKIGKAGWAGQLTGGIAGAALDPLTYVPVPGSAGASFAARVGKQAVFSSGMSVASEGLRSQATGIEGHYAEAAIGGAVVGGAAAAVLDRFIAKAAKGPQGRPEMSDADLEAVLARHDEGALPNREVDLPEGMEPQPAPQDREVDDDYLEKILGMHGERSHKQDALKEMPDDTVEGLLARHGESSEPNEFYGPTSRLQAREAARGAGQDDPTRMPWNTDDHPSDFNGVDYVDHPSERGAVRLRDGSIMSGSNPLNPKTLKMVAELGGPDRSARGFSLGAITEIGYKLNRSSDDEILDLGSKLFRSTVQTESGSNGRFAATASDIIERLRGEDNVAYDKLNSLTRSLLKDDPKYAGMGGSELGRMERAYRRVAEAIEDSSKAKVSKLSAQERALMDHINDHFMRKQDVLENPAQFGNAKATAVLDNTRHAGHYVPNVYDDTAKALFLKKFGGNADNLQEAIKGSWLASYASRAVVKARVDKYIKEAIEKEGKVATPELMKQRVERYAHDKAYGISHTQDFNRSTQIDDGLNQLVGAENNNFLEARNLFDSDVSVPLSDGSTFAVNDLRVFDFTKLMPSYDRRINGDVGIMAATGEGTDALKARILKLKTAGKNADEVVALESAVKLLTGRARRDPDDAFGTALRSLNDLSFFTKNAYMGAQNLTEIAGMVTNGHLRMLMKGVPFLREMTTWGSKISPENLKDMHGLIFGRELDDIIRPRRADIVERLRAQGSNGFVAQTVGSLKFATGELAARSPFTKFLTETSNYIMDAGRQGALMDLVRAAHGETPRILKDSELHRLSITKAQFEEMKSAIREHLVPDGQGFKIRDAAALRSDPRTMDIWRLGDKIADESILRPHKLSSQDSRALGAGWHMALQFKKFVFRSLNGRLMRGIYDTTKNKRGIDFAIQSGVATGLAAGFYVAQRYVQAQGMPPEQRKDFLKNALTPEMLGWAALSRNNILGSPIGVANFVLAPLGYDPAAAVRTSVLPRGPEFSPRDRPVRYSPLRSDGIQAPMSKLLEQVPSAGIIGSVYQVGANADGLWKDTRREQELGYMTGMYNGLRGLIPNDPVSQRALSALMQEQGMEYQQRR